MRQGFYFWCLSMVYLRYVGNVVHFFRNILCFWNIFYSWYFLDILDILAEKIQTLARFMRTRVLLLLAEPQSPIKSINVLIITIIITNHDHNQSSSILIIVNTDHFFCWPKYRSWSVITVIINQDHRSHDPCYHQHKSSTLSSSLSSSSITIIISNGLHLNNIYIMKEAPNCKKNKISRFWSKAGSVASTPENSGI